MFWGALLVLVGALILLNRAGVINLGFSDYLVPVILIAWGVRVMLSKKRN